MTEWFKWLFDELLKIVSTYGWWIGAASVVMFVVSLVVIRVLLVQIPPDYFHRRDEIFDGKRHPVVSLVIFLARNSVGAVLVILGLVMSLPGVLGQGVLTILIGLSVMDFPGKRKLQMKIIGQPLILKTINGIRSKAGKAPLEISDDDLR